MNNRYSFSFSFLKQMLKTLLSGMQRKDELQRIENIPFMAVIVGTLLPTEHLRHADFRHHWRRRSHRVFLRGRIFRHRPRCQRPHCHHRQRLLCECNLFFAKLIKLLATTTKASTASYELSPFNVSRNKTSGCC